jgi:hypothetical protein
LSISADDKVAAAALLLVKVMVSKVLPPDTMEFGENTLAMLGGLIASKLSVVGLGLLPLVVCNAPAGMVLTKVPPTVALTVTIIVQVPGVPSTVAAGIIAPVLNLKLPVPTGAIKPAPPAHVVVADDGEFTTIPAGNASIKSAVKVAAVKLLFDRVMVITFVPSTATVLGAANDLTMLGALDVLVLRVA